MFNEKGLVEEISLRSWQLEVLPGREGMNTMRTLVVGIYSPEDEFHDVLSVSFGIIVEGIFIKYYVFTRNSISFPPKIGT